MRQTMIANRSVPTETVIPVLAYADVTEAATTCLTSIGIA